MLHERLATASLHSATPKEKHSLHFWFGGGEIFFEKGKGVFSFGVLPVKIFGQCGGAQCNLAEAKQKLFLREEKDCFASAQFFSKRRDSDFRRAGGYGRNARR